MSECPVFELLPGVREVHMLFPVCQLQFADNDYDLTNNTTTNYYIHTNNYTFRFIDNIISDSFDSL